MSSDFLNVLGTLRQIFRIGLNGPMFVADSDVKLRIVNIDNSEYRRLEIANPIDPQDAVTKIYNDAIFALMVPKVLTLSTVEGIQGGGDLSANRTLKLDINGLVEDFSPDAAADYIVEYDTSTGFHKKVKIVNLAGVIDHDLLFNFVASKHVDHLLVFINTTEGIQGGGDISVTRNLKLDINGLAADATPDSAADYVATYDFSAGLHKKVLLSNMPGASGEANLAANVGTGTGNVFRDKTGVTLNFRTIKLGSTKVTVVVSTNDVVIDIVEAFINHDALLNWVANKHIDHTAISVLTTEGIQGGGDISANRTHKLDINGLTEDTTPDSANDFVATYDASATLHKKVRPSNITPKLHANTHASAGTDPAFHRQVFSGSGSFTVPANVTQIIVFGRGGAGGGAGGGGGGGGSTVAGAGGGGAGSTGGACVNVECKLTVTPGDVITVTIGAGGTAGTGGAGGAAAAGGNNGANGTSGGRGGTTTFGALATFVGGYGGTLGNFGGIALAGLAGSTGLGQYNLLAAIAGNGGLANVAGVTPSAIQRFIYRDAAANGTGGNAGGANGGGGGGAGAGGMGAMPEFTPQVGANGGNGGAAGAAGVAGAAAGASPGGGCPGTGGGGGGGGGLLAVTGTAGGVGGNGTAGSAGEIVVEWIG